GQARHPADWARPITRSGMPLGVSCHGPDEVDAAAADPLFDYFCTGPVWPTPTKPGRHAPGLDLVRHAATTVGDSRPWFAIGGIDSATLGEVVEAGARRGVLVRALAGAADPTSAARDLRAALLR